MSHALPALLLGVCIILGLLLVPLGLPGLWVMVAGIVGYGWLTDFRSIGVATIAVVWASHSWVKSSKHGWDFASRGRSAARDGRRGARSSAGSSVPRWACPCPSSAACSARSSDHSSARGYLSTRCPARPTPPSGQGGAP